MHRNLAEAAVPPPPQTDDAFPVADTLRAVGAFAVLTTHVAFWTGNYTGNGTIGGLLARLDVGVAIFFVLSGFLLGRGWVARAASQRPRPATGPYLWKRFLRIMPLYVVVATLALALIGSNDGLGVRDWLVTLTLTNTFVDPSLPAGLTQMWSLAVEATFYLVLPLLMAAIVGRRLHGARFLGGLAAMTALSVVWILLLAPRLGSHVSGVPTQWLPAYLTWFAAGLLLAYVQVLHARGTGSRAVARMVELGRQPGACWALVGGLMLVASTPLAGPTMLTAATSGESLAKHVLYAAVGLLVVLTAVFADTSRGYGRALAHPAGRRLGWISYGVFCLHLPILHLVMWVTGWRLFQGHGLELWVVAVLLSVAAAEIGYRLVERPALALKSRPPRLLRSEDAETTTATSGTSSR